MANPYLTELKLAHKMSHLGSVNTNIHVRVQLLSVAMGTPAMARIEALIMDKVAPKEEFEKLINDLEKIGCTPEQRKRLIPLLNRDHVVEALAFK
jgi:hypothetical protein